MTLSRTALLALTVLNLILLTLNLTTRSSAEVSGKDWVALARDDDFRLAVSSIVSQCKIDVTGGPPRILCGR